jgi:hypothetical protein
MEASLLSCHSSMEWKLRSINLDRPYSSEQATPTLEELVGVSELRYFLTNLYGDLEESKAQLAELFNQLDPLAHPISIEEENQRMLQAISSTPPKLDSVAVDLGSLDNGNTNVLLTRAERHRSRSLRGPLLEGLSGAGRPDDGGYTTQPQTSEQLIADRPSEVLTRFSILPSRTQLGSGWLS